MAKKKKQPDKFINLSWDDLEEWAGSRVVDRGERYQKQGRVSELALTEDDCLIAWVNGSERYATKVSIGKNGAIESTCTCPYTFECKHGVAAVLEYIYKMKRNISVPRTDKNDERLRLIHRDLDDDDISQPGQPDSIELFLKDRSREEMIGLIHELCVKYPEVNRYIHDRKNFSSGNIATRIKHIQKQINEATKEPGWQNHWDSQGFTPDFSEIRENLETLMDEGHADEVLSLGRELMSSGIELVEMSDDEGETAAEIEGCMPVIIRALEKSSLAPVAKLEFALDSIIDDEYSLFEPFYEYINFDHPADVWNEIADILLAKLNNFPDNSAELGLSRYKRDLTSNWAVNALKKSGRDKEILPLYEKEAPITRSYSRLVKILIENRQYDEAEKWIQKGISHTKDQWPGIASDLRGQLLDIRTKQKKPQSVVALRVYEYVEHPSTKAYQVCKETAEKIKEWKKVRTCIMGYLEKGKLPWKQSEWPLPQPDIEYSGSKSGREYPMINELISTAIFEKEPEKVIFWYDKGISEKRWRFGFNTDEIADAIKTYSPERAVGMWQAKAEGLIDQVNPRAYEEAARYLKKAKKVMHEIKKQDTWDKYIQGLKNTHIRKKRLLEILNRMDKNPIIKIKSI